MPCVTVVIPNWNGLVHLPECMVSLRRQTFTDFEVVVVDNGSTDGSVAWLRENAPWVRLIERPDNGGFAVAVNAGIAVADGEFVALLNNDTLVDERWIEALVAALEESGYDFAASLMVFYDSPDVVNAAGDDFVVSLLSGRNRGLGQKVEDFRRPERVLGACAGAALYRTNLFREVGMFDEDFFLIHEDTDMNLRALIAGKRCLYVPSAIVRHKHSATIKAQPAWAMLRYEARNRGVVVAKDIPATLLPLVAVLWPWHLARSTFPIRPSMWHKVPGLTASLGKRIAAEVEGFGMGWRKRRDVWSRRTVPTSEIIRWLFRGVGPV